MAKRKLPMGYGKPSGKASATKGGTKVRNPLGSPKGQFSG